MENCLICRCDFDKESEITHCHQCVYKYHRDCLESWFAMGPIEKSFQCMVCKSDLYLDDTSAISRPFYTKLEKFFDCSSFLIHFRWIAIYTLFVFIGNVSVCLYTHLGNYIILHYQVYIDNIVQTHCLLNMVFIHLVYPMICYIYDIIVFQKYLKRHYRPDIIEDFRSIYHDCNKLVTIGMTFWYVALLVSDKKYVLVLLH